MPYDVDFTPDGTSPLLKHADFMDVKCPVCGANAKRDADTMDTFVCSSWYFLRYPDCCNDKAAFDTALIDKMLPVDVYIGGAEHACLHLLYARFFVKALRDIGLLHFDEPFLRLINQGIILGTDGEKMSKSSGNVVSPDDYIDVYGSDVFRMYLEFGFNYIEGGAWNDDGIKAMARFLDRVERLIQRIMDLKESACTSDEDAIDGEAIDAQKELSYVLANTILHVTEDLDRFSFNTAIARIMELVNAMYRAVDDADLSAPVLWDAADKLVHCLAPFAPHFAEEMHRRMGGEDSVFKSDWPAYDPKALTRDIVNMAVQINGRVRSRIDIEQGMVDDEVQRIALADKKVRLALGVMTVKKIIVIPGRLVNIVAG